MTRKSITVLLFVVLVVATGYGFVQATEWYLESRLEREASKNLGRTVTVGDVDLGMFPVEVRVDNVASKSPTETGLYDFKLSSLTVRPRLTSFFAETIVLNRITIEKPSVTLRTDTRASGNREASAGPDGSKPLGVTEFSLPLEIRNIQVSGGSFSWQATGKGTVSHPELTGVSVQAGPITNETLRTGLDFHGGATLRNDNGRVAFLLRLYLDDNPRVKGEVRSRQVSLSVLNSYLGENIRIETGTLSGDFPFELSPDRLRIKRTTGRVEHLSAWIDQAPRIEPDTRPLEQIDDSVDTGPRDEPLEVPIEVQSEEIRLEVLDADVTMKSGDDVRTVKIDRSTMLTDSMSNLNDSFTVKTQVAINEPSGLLEAKGTVLPLKSHTGVNDLIGRLVILDVSQLTPYLGASIPVRLKKGRMDLATRGAVTSQDLALTVDMNFRNLDTAAGNTNQSSVFGIPVNLFVNYLQQNNGNLDLYFTVGGTPRRPVLDTTRIRTRVLVNLGVDAAVIGSIGAPVYLGDKLLEQASGVSLLGTAKDAVGSLISSDPRNPDPVFELDEFSQERWDDGSGEAKPSE